MATQHTSTLKETAGDYADMDLWIAGEGRDLSDIQIFSVSNEIGVPYTDDEALSFDSSGATATFIDLVAGVMRVHVLTGVPTTADNVSGDVSGATADIDTIDETGGESEYLEISEAWTADDDSSIDLADFSGQSATHNLKIEAIGTSKARWPTWDNQFLWKAGDYTDSHIDFGVTWCTIIGLGFEKGADNNGRHILFTQYTDGGIWNIESCSFRMISNNSVNRAITCNGPSNSNDDGTTGYISNCIFKFDGSSNSNKGIVTGRGTWYAYSNTFYGTTDGIIGGDTQSTTVIKNNVYDGQQASGTPTGFSDTFDAASTNNVSTHATDEAETNSALIEFIDQNAHEVGLDQTVTGDAIDGGANLYADSDIAITVDFNGNTRPNAAQDCGAIQSADIENGGAYTMKPSGGDYDDFTVWESAWDAEDWIASNERHELECYAGTYVESVAIVCNPWTVNPNVFTRVFAAAGNYHLGVPGAGVVLECTDTNPSAVFYIGTSGGSKAVEGQDGFRLEDLEFIATGTLDQNFRGHAVQPGHSHTCLDVRVDRCIMQMNPNDTYPNSAQGFYFDQNVRQGNMKVRNCLIYDARIGLRLPGISNTSISARSTIAMGFAGQVQCIGNTIIAHATVGGIDGFFSSGESSTNCKLKNNILRSFSTNDIDAGSSNADADYNVVGDTSSFGVNSIDSGTIVFEDEASQDFRPASGDSAIDNALDLTTESWMYAEMVAAATMDITRTARPVEGGSWTMGCFGAEAPPSVTAALTGSIPPSITEDTMAGA